MLLCSLPLTLAGALFDATMAFTPRGRSLHSTVVLRNMPSSTRDLGFTPWRPKGDGATDMVCKLTPNDRVWLHATLSLSPQSATLVL